MINWSDDTAHLFANPRLPKEMERPEALPKAHIAIATSGTTGNVKWALLSKKAFLVSAEAVNAHLGATSQDVWINPLPIFHVGGLAIYARAYLTGSKVITMDKWDPKLFVEQCVRGRTSFASLVPAQLFDLIKSNLHAPPCLKAVIIGGGALNPSLFEKGLVLKWPLAPSYGMTECASQIATALPGSDKMRVLPHVEIEGSPLKIRSEALFTSYFVNGQFYDSKEEGWFQTEDLVQVENGILTPLGRKGDWIKILGENVHILSLQTKIESLCMEEGIEGALLASPDERKGSRLVFLFEGDINTANRCRSLYNDQVMPYERIEEMRKVESIPRTALGKVIQNSMWIRS